MHLCCTTISGWPTHSLDEVQLHQAVLRPLLYAASQVAARAFATVLILPPPARLVCCTGPFPVRCTALLYAVSHNCALDALL